MLLPLWFCTISMHYKMISPLRNSGSNMYHLLHHSWMLHFVHKQCMYVCLYVCVSYCLQSEQWHFHWTTLTGWSLYQMFCSLCGRKWISRLLKLHSSSGTDYLTLKMKARWSFKISVPIYQLIPCNNPEHLKREIRLTRGNLNTQRETCPSAPLTTKKSHTDWSAGCEGDNCCWSHDTVNTVVSTVTRLGAGWTGVWLPADARQFFLLPCVQTYSGVHPASGE
jgi:hypothetical protein